MANAVARHTSEIHKIFQYDDSLFPLLRELHKTLHKSAEVYRHKDAMSLLFSMSVMNNVRKQVAELFILYENKFGIPREIINDIWTNNEIYVPCVLPSVKELKEKYAESLAALDGVIAKSNPLKALQDRVEKLEAQVASLMRMNK